MRNRSRSPANCASGVVSSSNSGIKKPPVSREEGGQSPDVCCGLPGREGRGAVPQNNRPPEGAACAPSAFSRAAPVCRRPRLPAGSAKASCRFPCAVFTGAQKNRLPLSFPKTAAHSRAHYAPASRFLVLHQVCGSVLVISSFGRPVLSAGAFSGAPAILFPIVADSSGLVKFPLDGRQEACYSVYT